MTYQVIEGPTPGAVAEKVSGLVNVKLVGTMQSYLSGIRIFYQVVASSDFVSQYDVAEDLRGELDSLKSEIDDIRQAVDDLTAPSPSNLSSDRAESGGVAGSG